MSGLQICRLCAKCKLCIDIYSNTGIQLVLPLKIKTCLPIQVSEQDKLSRGICQSCIKKLNTAYELVVTCVLAQSRLETEANEQQEVTSSQPLTSANNGQDSVIARLTVENLARFNSSNYGNSPKVPVITSVLTLANGPRPQSVLPVKISGEDDERPKNKKRKTVCCTCKEWFERSEIEEHEKSHTNKGRTAENNLEKG